MLGTTLRVCGTWQQSFSQPTTIRMSTTGCRHSGLPKYLRKEDHLVFRRRDRWISTQRDFLWGAFGPQTQSWLNQGMPRPFDEPNNAAVEVDGFDFDIEVPSPGKNQIRREIYDQVLTINPYRLIAGLYCYDSGTTKPLPDSKQDLYYYWCATMCCAGCEHASNDSGSVI